MALSLYCVFGAIQGKGTGLQKKIHEHTQAHSPAQAKLNVAKRLQNQYKENIFTGDCEAELYTKIHP